MTVTISRAQRDALYEEATDDLSAIGDIQLALDNGNGEEARHLWRRFDADLRLLDQIGWARTDPREEFTIDLPPELLVRVLGRMEDRAQHAISEHLAQPNDHLEIARRGVEVLAVCRGAFEQLADKGAWGERA